MRSKQINRPEYAPRHQRRIFLGIPLDSLPESYKLTYRPPGPNDPHRSSPGRFGLACLAPGIQPLHYLFVTDSTPRVQFSQAALNLAELPLLSLHVPSDRLRGKKRLRAVGSLGEDL